MTLTVEDGTDVLDANSYVSVTDATNYLTGNASTAAAGFLAASTAVKEFYLIYATVVIDSYFNWAGERANINNELEWPRTGATSLCTGGNIAESFIPGALKSSVIELAVDLYASPEGTRSTDTNNTQVSSVQADTVRITFDTRLGNNRAVISNVVSNHIKTLLRCFGSYAATGTGIRFGNLVTGST